MSPAEIAAATKLRLASEIDEEMKTLETALGRIRELAERMKTNQDWVLGNAMAFEVERWYTTLEALVERLLRALDGAVPTGAAHHREVLHAASLPVEPLRPALLPKETEADLRQLLAFRHLVRHAYDVELDWSRLLEHARRVERVHGILSNSMAALAQRLRSEAN